MTTFQPSISYSLTLYSHGLDAILKPRLIFYILAIMALLCKHANRSSYRTDILLLSMWPVCFIDSYVEEPRFILLLVPRLHVGQRSLLFLDILYMLFLLFRSTHFQALLKG